MRWGWILILLMIAATPLVQAQSSGWRPIGSTSTPAPAARLGLPITKPSTTVARSVSPDPLKGETEERKPAASLGPLPGIQMISSLSLGPISDDTPEERYNWGMIDLDRVDRFNKKEKNETETSNKSFSDWFKKLSFNKEDDGLESSDPIKGGLFSKPTLGLDGNGTFESDSDCFNFASPITNPFFAEDPRRLTEIRPLFLYQVIPNSQFFFRGGSIQYYGIQGRLGLTERWSVTINKLGGISFNPGSDSIVDGETSLAEIWLGPKFTFYKSKEYGAIASAGVIFQIPAGRSETFQDTGNFGLAPYVTGAYKFGRSSFGSFTILDTIGYNFGLSNKRSDFLYNTLHLDYDLFNWGKIYPLIELNYFVYTSNGLQRPNLGFEGADLANVGAAVSGRNQLNIAFGSRFQIIDRLQFGLAAEFPLIGTRDLNNFRFTADFIWRY